MSRKGYNSELVAKKKLIAEFGFINVFKNAISNQGADYLVVSKGRLVKCIEVKESHEKKYHPMKSVKEQFIRIKQFTDEHNIPVEVWLHYPKTKIWEVHSINDYI